MNRAKMLVLSIAVSLMLQTTVFADHVVFRSDVVDRSTITIASVDEGTLALKITWGDGAGARGTIIKYKEAYGSVEHKKAMVALAVLLSDSNIVSFGDAELSTRIGLTIRQ